MKAIVNSQVQCQFLFTLTFISLLFFFLVVCFVLFLKEFLECIFRDA